MKLELTFKEIFKQNSCTNACDFLKFWFRIQFFKFFRSQQFIRIHNTEFPCRIFQILWGNCILKQLFFNYKLELVPYKKFSSRTAALHIIRKIATPQASRITWPTNIIRDFTELVYVIYLTSYHLLVHCTVGHHSADRCYNRASAAADHLNFLCATARLKTFLNLSSKSDVKSSVKT